MRMETLKKTMGDAGGRIKREENEEFLNASKLYKERNGKFSFSLKDLRKVASSSNTA